MQIIQTSAFEIILELDEVFDFKCIHAFKESYESTNLDRCKSFHVDFSQTKYMDSSALGMLLNLHQVAHSKGATILLINTDDQIKRILRIARFEQKFTIQ